MKHIYIYCFVLFLLGCNVGSLEKTNVILILADDLGWAQLGCYGSDYYQTPHIDGLAEEGIRFTDAYAAAPVCSPTRASIMTGKYPARLGLTNFIPGNPATDSLLVTPEWQKHLPLEEKTIAEVAKGVGYATAHFGKWHLSSQKTPPESLPYNPDKQGFDSTFVTYKPVANMEKSWQTSENDAHNVDTITNLSLAFMEKNQNQPFFLVVSHNTIHDPLMEKEALIAKYKSVETSGQPENHPVVAAMIETLDESVGTILQKLDELDLTNQTMVIFYSDNGGKHAYAAQTPFRKGKGWLYEGGIRVPLIIRWPGHIQEGAIDNSLVISNDFYPTLASVFKAEITQVDGINIRPCLDQTQLSRENLYWHFPHYHLGSGMKPASAIRHGKYKLIEWHEDKLTGQKRYVELYDLQTDPGENNNMADSLNNVAKEMLEMLDSWKSEVNAQLPAVRAD